MSERLTENIARLRDESEEDQGYGESWYWQPAFLAEVAAEVEALRADRDVLAGQLTQTRTALREIADLPDPLGPRNSPAAAQCDYLKDIARAALVSGGEET